MTETLTQTMTQTLGELLLETGRITKSQYELAEREEPNGCQIRRDL